MKKLIPIITFIFSCQFLFAQPKMDLIHPGIKSVCSKKCEYKLSGDSTGMEIYAECNYDIRGRMIQFFDNTLNEKTFGVDTLFFQYFEGSTKVCWGSHCDLYTLYKYDKNGLCIREQTFKNKKIDEDYIYNYDKHGKLLATYFVNSRGVKIIREKRKYDSSGRLVYVSAYIPGTNEIQDSTSFCYSEIGKLVKVYDSKSNEISDANYDLNDSLVGRRVFRLPEEFALSKGSRSKLYYTDDSLSIVRDPSGTPLYSYEWNKTYKTQIYISYSNNLIKKKFELYLNDTSSVENWNYNSINQLVSYHFREYNMNKKTEFFYNTNGDLIETRSYSLGILEERVIYEIVYY